MAKEELKEELKEETKDEVTGGNQMDIEHQVNINENVNVVITFKIQGTEWKKAQDKEFRRLAANLKVKGFRQGHVPLDMARKMVSPQEVIQGATLTTVNKVYSSVLTEHQLRPFTEPKLNITKLDNESVEAEVTFALPPKVELGEYKGLKIEKKEVVVSDEDKKDFIEQLRKDQATMNVKEGEAALGDSVTIDFKGYIDDSPFDGGEAKNYELELGSNSFVPGFEDQLVGMKEGEKRSIEVKFPDNYVKSLQGKLARFDVTCHEVKEKVLPELNEDFFGELNLDGVTNVDELDAYALKTLTARKERENYRAYQEAILDQVIANSKVYVGDAILTQEAQTNIANIKKQVESNGLSFEDYLSINGIDQNKLLEDKKNEALDSFKHVLVIEEICRKENIRVTKEQLDAKYQEIATQYNMKVEDVIKTLEPSRDQFILNMRNAMFEDFLAKNNQ